jgi:hypothetical protein
MPVHSCVDLQIPMDLASWRYYSAAQLSSYLQRVYRVPHDPVTDELAAFITSGISITLAARSPANIPSAARAKGCRLLRGAVSRLRLFVSASQARQVIADVKATGMISVTFSVPETHRTVQFKGIDACVTGMQPEELPLLEQYLHTFTSRIEPLGFTPEFARAFFASPGDEVALEFSPSEAFQQTPGPNAGARL